MIDRQHDKIIWECDACGDTFEWEDDDFHGGWTAAKDEGWRAKLIGTEWTHLCPPCGASDRRGRNDR
jgi:hypothetical protein